MGQGVPRPAGAGIGLRFAAKGMTFEVESYGKGAVLTRG
jgi:hypothetical protein